MHVLHTAAHDRLLVLATIAVENNCFVAALAGSRMALLLAAVQSADEAFAARLATAKRVVRHLVAAQLGGLLAAVALERDGQCARGVRTYTGSTQEDQVGMKETRRD